MPSRDKTTKKPDPEEPDPGRRPCLPMLVKLCAVGGAYVLVASLMLAYSVPAVRLALGNLMLGDEPNESEPAVDRIVSFFADGFDQMDPHWYWLQLTGVERSLTVRDGRIFMNLTNRVTDERLWRVYVCDSGEGRGNRWLYVCVEVGLRCSDDNGLESGVGRGMRCWGLTDNHPGFPENCMLFRSESPESDKPGLYVLSKGAGEEGYECPVSVDIREWHNYTILWRPGNGTFLIDDEVVGSTDRVPSAPMAIAFHAENGCYTENRTSGRGPDFPISDNLWLSYLLQKENQSMEIDHVRVFMIMEDYEGYSARVCGLIANASSLIEAADSLGLNTTAMRVDFASLSEDWNTAGYVHGETHMRVLAMMELWGRVEEMAGLFREASERIASAREMGYEDLRVLETFYDKAGEAWDDYDYDRTGIMLETVIGWDR